jgi:hypothetical protein
VIGTTEGRSEAIHPAIHGAGLAVANIPHCYCTFFTIGAARQPSLIAFGERFKVLEFGVTALRSLGEPPKQSRLGGFKVDDQLIFGRWPDRAVDVTMLSLSRPQRRWSGHARSAKLFRAGPEQSILLNAAAPRPFVRQMESTEP